MYECIVCNKIVNQTDEKYMLGVDMPYINLYIHRDCWHSIKSYSSEFLKENLLEYINKHPVIEKKRK